MTGFIFLDFGVALGSSSDSESESEPELLLAAFFAACVVVTLALGDSFLMAAVLGFGVAALDFVGAAASSSDESLESELESEKNTQELLL